MATPLEITELRNMTKQPENVEPYTDTFLGEMIDAYGLRVSAGKIWESKAASVAHLVDISEGGSSRKMSDVYKQFLAMANTFGGDDGSGENPGAVEAPRSRKAVRA